MEMTVRELWTLVHGMGFGALYLLACSGAVVELWRHTTGAGEMSAGQERFVRAYLVVMVAMAWMAVLTGAYVVYPWYRAVPPAGTAELAGYPQRLLLSHAETSGWHSLGMEWKEHVAWLAPIAITMAAAVFWQYGRELRLHKQLRAAVLGFTVASFVAASVAGFFGAMLDKVAPRKGRRNDCATAWGCAMKTNGAGAAAVLAAGVGSAMLGVMSFAGDKWPAVKAAMVWYKSTGALSGVTTVAILAWLVSWAVLAKAWGGKSVAMGRVSAVAFALLMVGFLLTFPPVMDLF